ncbi:MAG TPA: RsmE family RNA methyltransferase [Acidobacteriaceae bacterium]
MTRRRWIANDWDSSSAVLTGQQALHLARVLRARPGMRFDVVAGERVWQAEIASATEEQVRFVLLEELDAEPALPLTLLIAVFKFDRLEWAIEKATELGVRRMVPVLARRTEKHLAQAAISRVERWRRIAQEAAKQSRRSQVPAVADPTALEKAVSLPPGTLGFVLSENARQHTLRPAVAAAADQEIAMATGPEGGWTAEEEALFNAQSWAAVSLGPRILRAETAVICAAAVLSALLDSW